MFVAAGVVLRSEINQLSADRGGCLWRISIMLLCSEERRGKGQFNFFGRDQRQSLQDYR